MLLLSNRTVGHSKSLAPRVECFHTAFVTVRPQSPSLSWKCCNRSAPKLTLLQKLWQFANVTHLICDPQLLGNSNHRVPYSMYHHVPHFRNVCRGYFSLNTSYWLIDFLIYLLIDWLISWFILCLLVPVQALPFGVGPGLRQGLPGKILGQSRSTSAADVWLKLSR